MSLLVICHLVAWGLILKNCVKAIYLGNNKVKMYFFSFFNEKKKKAKNRTPWRKRMKTK